MHQLNIEVEVYEPPSWCAKIVLLVRTWWWPTNALYAAARRLEAADVVQNRESYREFMVDDKLITDLRKRKESYTGPPLNKGGMR
jgi:hypothetical protein